MGKLVVTTSWDDGSLLDHKLIALMEKYGIKGTFYIPVSYLSNSLQEKDLKMIDEEFEIGAHTTNHFDLTSIPLKEAKREIEGSKAYLEDCLGHSIDMFCYPKGRFNRNIKRLTRNAGFIAARTVKYGGFTTLDDPYEWHITLHASNGSPMITLRTWLKSKISIKSLISWEIRAKLLFDLAIQNGGAYHLWGHSWEIEGNNEWANLERVFQYISNKESVFYLSNGDAFRYVANNPWIGSEV